MGDFASDLPAGPVGQLVDPSGSLYYLARGAGASTGVVARIDYTGQPGSGGPPGPPVPPVRVVDVRGASRTGSISRLAVTFSGALNRSSARNRNHYWLVLPGRDEILGTPDDRRIRIRAATYSRPTHSVRLVASRPIPARQTFALVVSGSITGPAVRDLAQRPIDGDGDGQPGGDFVAVLRGR